MAQEPFIHRLNLLNTQDNGNKVKNREREKFNIKISQRLKEILKMIKRMDTEKWYIHLKINIKVNGLMTKKMGKEQ